MSAKTSLKLSRSPQKGILDGIEDFLCIHFIFSGGHFYAKCGMIGVECEKTSEETANTLKKGNYMEGDSKWLINSWIFVEPPGAKNRYVKYNNIIYTIPTKILEKMQ